MWQVNPGAGAPSSANRKFEWQQTLGIVIEILLTLTTSIFSVLEGLVIVGFIRVKDRRDKDAIALLLTICTVAANSVQVPYLPPQKLKIFEI